jgi:hypothetical protein
MSQGEFKAPDFEQFCQALAEGCSQLEAFKRAGGYSTGKTKSWIKAAHRMARQDDVKDRVNQLMQEQAMAAHISILQLTPQAISVMQDVLSGKAKASEKDRIKVAENVLSRARDVLPKEINVKHEHGIKQIDLEGLIDKLIEHVPGEAAKLVEGEVVEQPGISEGTASSSEEDGDKQT